jgi:hypothetical protein
MSEQTPSQAAGEQREETAAEQESQRSDRRDVPRATPSQAEGDREVEQGEEEDARAWESGWSGP